MKILITRFSALGDIAMIAPVLKKITSENDWIHITMLTRSKYVALFEGIDRVEVIGLDLKREYSSIFDVATYCKKLHKRSHFDFYIDLHSVLRTWILRGYLRIFGLKSAGLDKGRSERARAIKNKNEQLPHQTVRYLDVFREACITVKDNILIPLDITQRKERGIDRIQFLKDEQKEMDFNKSIIGFAPFAAHLEKTWSIQHVQSFLDMFNAKKRGVILIFGHGESEFNQANTLISKISDNTTVINCINRWDFNAELDVISSLDTMVGMDSGNVHIASIFGVKTVVIWGATDARLGFSPTFHNVKNSITTNDDAITCRPCSVFGSKPCKYNTIRCMETIMPERVISLID